MSKKGKIIVVLIVAVLLASSAGFILFKKAAEKKMMLEADLKEQVYPVRTAECISGEIFDFIKINGSVIAEKSVDVNPDTGGKLKNCICTNRRFCKKKVQLLQMLILQSRVFHIHQVL